MSTPDSFELLLNPRHGTPGVTVLPNAGFRKAKAEITRWPGYAPTASHELLGIADVAVVRIKDESTRFGLGSFKALGGAYALGKLLAAELAHQGVARSASTIELADGRYADHTGAITITCATDGNHGRSVAWGAQRFHCRCVIFVHETVSQGRVDAIAHYGAQVERVRGTYDDAVRAANQEAKARGWFVVSDTSYPGYTEVPRDVMQGYRLMADEAADQWHGGPPTHVFVQAGVGGAAAAVSVQMRERFTPVPRLIVVEPDRAACLLASAKTGKATTVHGDLDTIMAGLACGEPSLLAWQELERSAWAFLSIQDEAAADTRRLLADRGLAIGESGVAGLAGLRVIAGDLAARSSLGLAENSRVLVFGTEGVIDTQVFETILGSQAD